MTARLPRDRARPVDTRVGAGRGTKLNRGLPCAARLYFANVDRATAADKVRHGGWEIDPEPCPCGGVHIRRKRGLRARTAGTVP